MLEAILWSVPGAPLKARRAAATAAPKPPAGRRAREATPEMTRLDRQPDADHRLVAGRHGGDEILAASPDLVGKRQGSREHDRARMQHGAHMGIVGVDTAGISGVQERGTHRVPPPSAEQYRSISLPPEARHIGVCPGAPRHPGPDGGNPNIVEEEL